jgi:hypothetical protein
MLCADSQVSHWDKDQVTYAHQMLKLFVLVTICNEMYIYAFIM